ncbi:winged helix-turn-helix domain-containing protein [Micromonospora aurantiaca]|uniref:winged helix-turn-helix domain-containing protein n=1 Tax=Micromonospora aurantiaca (nom. illeg.) TaxID=47850 RepID=UPI0033B7F573
MDIHVGLAGLGDRASGIYRQLLDAILDGRLRPGERLPPTRELARRLDVARNTVLVAYARLTAEGLAVARAGAATFVTDEPVARARPDRHRPPGYAPGALGVRRVGPCRRAAARVRLSAGHPGSPPPSRPHRIEHTITAMAAMADAQPLSHPPTTGTAAQAIITECDADPSRTRPRRSRSTHHREHHPTPDEPRRDQGPRRPTRRDRRIPRLTYADSVDHADGGTSSSSSRGGLVGAGPAVQGASMSTRRPSRRAGVPGRPDQQPSVHASASKLIPALAPTGRFNEALLHTEAMWAGWCRAGRPPPPGCGSPSAL